MAELSGRLCRVRMLRITNNEKLAAGRFRQCGWRKLQPQIIAHHAAAHPSRHTSRVGIMPDLRFELGELHVLMISNSAK
jgi:hypothetical protein